MSEFNRFDLSQSTPFSLRYKRLSITAIKIFCNNKFRSLSKLLKGRTHRLLENEEKIRLKKINNYKGSIDNILLISSSRTNLSKSKIKLRHSISCMDIKQKRINFDLYSQNILSCDISDVNFFKQVPNPRYINQKIKPLINYSPRGKNDFKLNPIRSNSLELTNKKLIFDKSINDSSCLNSSSKIFADLPILGENYLKKMKKVFTEQI